MKRHSDAMLLAIGVFKLVKASTLIAFGVIVLWHLHSDIGHLVRDVATELGFAGTNRRLVQLIERLGALEAKHGLAIGIGALVYAALFTVEGVGLVSRKVWGEYITTIITTSFVPLEVYELIEKCTWLKALLIAVNVAIVVYLVLRLRRDGHWPFARRRGTKDHGVGEAVGDAPPP